MMLLQDGNPLEFKTVFQLNFDFKTGWWSFLSHGQKSATNASRVPQNDSARYEKIFRWTLWAAALSSMAEIHSPREGT